MLYGMVCWLICEFKFSIFSSRVGDKFDSYPKLSCVILLCVQLMAVKTLDCKS